MPEEKTEKRKRGRPRKTQTEPPVVSEERKVLLMSDKSGTSVPEKITMTKVQDNLHSFYSRLLNLSGPKGSQISWMDTLGGLNRYNPYLQNQRLKQINTTPSEVSREELVTMLKNPSNQETPLRAAGWSLSSSQQLYYKILRLAADVPMYKYYKVPQFLETEKDYKDKKFAEEDAFVDEWLTRFDVVNTLKRTALETKRAGKSTYLLRNSLYRDSKGKRHVDFATWQKLPDEYVKLTAIGEHGYVASFDMMVFMNPAYNVKQYPDFIGEIWNDMINNNVVTIDPYVNKYSVDLDALRRFEYKDANGKLQKGIFEWQEERYLFWVQLPQEVCYTFASDSSHPWAVPDTSGLFLNLQELSDYGTLAGLVASTPLTAVLTGEAEFIDDCNAGQDQTKLSPETIAGLQNNFNSLVSDNVSAVFLPFKNIKLQSLPNIPNSNDIMTKAVQNFVSLAGEGGVIVATDKPSVAQVKGAQLLEEAQQDFVTQQFASIINFIINNLLGCEYSWKVVLWGGIFSFDADFKRAKELLQSGATFMLPRVASAFDMSVRDVAAVNKYVKSLGVYNEFSTLTQSSQEKASSSDEDKEEAKENVEGVKQKVGRPEKDDNEVDNDNTAASKDAGTNTSEGRAFATRIEEAVREGKCVCCGEEVDDGELLCENCKELFSIDILESEGNENQEIIENLQSQS